MLLGGDQDGNEGNKLLSINPGREGGKQLSENCWKKDFSSATLAIFWENGGRYTNFQFSQL